MSKRVIIELNEKDFLEYNLYNVFNVIKMRNAFIMSFIIVHITIFFTMVALEAKIQIAILTALLLGIIVDLGIVWLFRNSVMKTAEKQAGLIGRHEIKIDDKGIYDTASTHNIFMLWSDITDIRVNKNYIYIYRGNIFSFIIPRRHFLNEFEATEFLKTLVEYKKSESI